MNRLTLLLLSILVIFSYTNAKAQNIHLQDVSTQFRLIEDEGLIISFENHLGEMNAFAVQTKAGGFTEISIPGYGSSTDEGNPKLPVLRQLLEVPYGAGFDISYTNIETRMLKLNSFDIYHPIFPAQPPIPKNIENPDELEFVVNQATYSQNAFYGQELVTVTDEGFLRGLRLARLEISPIKYNPVTGELLVITGFTCEINFRGGNLSLTEFEKNRVFSPYFEANFRQLINHSVPENRELITNAPVTYIIVSDPMFQSALQPFIQWKTRKGFRVVEAYTNNPSVGTTTTSIKAYLKNFYQNPPAGYMPQSFVLLVGDVAQIPAFSGTAGSHITDLYFCEYTNDKLPEAYYGRFSASTLSQLQPQIDKTLEYEQYLMPDPSFLDKVVMIAGADASHQLTWGNGQINYGTAYYFNAAHGLLSYTYLQPEPSGANYASNIRLNVSNGVAYANYTAHGSSSGWADPSFQTSHISALQNNHKYPLMVGNCCQTSMFGGNCFAEEIVRAANKGAIGYIGGSNYTYWDEDYWWGVGFKTVATNPVYNSTKLGAYDRTFHDQLGIGTENWFVTQGQMVSAGNLAVQQSNSSMKNYYWEIYHLMGDPSLMVYFSQPPDIQASYPENILVGTSSFTINTEPYAYVGVSKNNVLHGAALADANGIAELMLTPFAETGIANIVVTRQNGKPFIGTITVVEETGADIELEAFQIDDSNGNNNQIADFSETIFLDITLQNSGNENAFNVLGTLSSVDGFVQITKSQQMWAEISAGQSITIQGSFEIIISDQAPDQHLAECNLTLSDGANVWNETILLTLAAPHILISQPFIDDSQGNGNGKPDAGETLNLVFPITNAGHSQVPEVFAVLGYVGNWVQITNPEYFTGTLDPSQSENTVFEITIDPDIQFGTVLGFQMEAGFGAYIAELETSLVIGEVIENFETGNFLAFPWELTGNADWFITGSNPQEGSWCAQSGMVSHQQYSAISISMDILQDGEISFWSKVSCENENDNLTFIIDGVGMMGWSGNGSWYYSAWPVTAGEHTFTWEYRKNSSVTSYSDCAWLDVITFPPANIPFLPIADFTADATTAATGETVQFTSLSSGNPTQFFWYFEGGTPGFSEEENPLVTYEQPGSYDVILVVTNSHGSDTKTSVDFIEVIPEATNQLLFLPQGWSGLSSYLVPENPDLTEMFGPIMGDLVILQQMNGVFSPMFGVNSIGEWDSQTGYKIKLENPAYLQISGSPVSENQLDLQEGWNLMPVLSACPVSAEEIFQNFAGNIQVVKEIAGMGTYWPEMNINTLGSLMPGNAYFILINSPITLLFPDCK